MKKIIATIVLIIVLVSSIFILSGCTLKIETNDNSVSASVDGDTTEKVDGIIDWIKKRIQRIFDTDDSSDNNSKEVASV